MPGLRMWGWADVLGRTFPLHQLSLCVMVFMLFCLSFEMREKLEIMIFINFLLLFIASVRAASSSSSLSSLPLPHHLKKYSALLFITLALSEVALSQK